MNERNTNTKSFGTRAAASAYPTRAEYRQRRKRKLIAILAVLLLIAAALTVAIVLVVRDVTGAGSRGGEDSIVTSSGSDATDAHPTAYAYDADDNSYYQSPTLQSDGSWFRLTLERETDVSAVSLLSYHDTCYVRSAVIELSRDANEWVSLGEFTGSPNNAAATELRASAPVTAQYVRIRLTSNSAEPYVINTVAVISADGTAVGIRSSMSGSAPAGGEQTDEPVLTSAPSGWKALAKSSADVHTGDLILVSTQYQYVFPSSAASIVKIFDNRTPFKGDDGTVKYSYTTGDIDLVTMESRALKQLNAMIDDFYKETGINQLHVGSNGGYRSFETQQELANKYPASAAVPGYSEHHTGLSVDLDIFDPATGATHNLDDGNAAGAAALAWIRDNAYKYGFVRRYPDNKTAVTGMSPSYLYRYVGYPHAYFMSKLNDLCLEEYLTYLASNYEYTDKHLEFLGDDGNKYEIYYVAAAGGTDVTNLPVPEGAEYTVSGNNYSGYIVTITR